MAWDDSNYLIKGFIEEVDGALDRWSGGGASSWDDLKNRPFGSNGMVNTPLFENIVLTSDGGMFMYEGENTSGLAPIEGDAVKVVLNGVAYDDTWGIYQGFPCCGNLGAIGAGDDTGEPYILIMNAEAVQLMVFGIEADTCTASAYAVVEDIRRLDEKYLPGVLLPHSAERGNFMAYVSNKWIPCANPAYPKLIEQKDVEYGTSEISFTIDKPYTKLILSVSNPHVSGSVAKDIEVCNFRPGLVVPYIIGKMKGAARPKGGGECSSFMIIEYIPGIGYLSFAPSTSLDSGSYNYSGTEMDFAVMRSGAPAFCVTNGSGDASTELRLRISDDTFVADGLWTHVKLYGILDYANLL